MTGPVSAQELLALAEGQLRELAGNTLARPEQLAVAWPAFLRAGEHLFARIAARPSEVAVPGRPSTTDEEYTEQKAAADPQLARAATLLAAAGDLFATIRITIGTPDQTSRDFLENWTPPGSSP